MDPGLPEPPFHQEHQDAARLSFPAGALRALRFTEIGMTTQTTPTYDELVDKLQDVTASLGNVMLAHGDAMTPADRLSRTNLVSEAEAMLERAGL